MKIINTFLYVFLSSIMCFAQNFCEPNDDFSQACQININQNYNSYIQANKDKDYFILSIPEAGIIVVDLITVPASLNLDIFIYNEDQNEIRGNYDVFNSNPYNLEVSVCDPGIYYVYIRDGDIGSSHGSEFDIENPYEFKVDFIPSSNTDNCECNQSFAYACPINSGEFVSALIGPTYFKVSNSSSSTRDRDYYSINAPEAGIIVVDLITVPSSLNLDIFIYNEDQEEIRGNYDVFNSNPYDLEVSVCDPGIYYVYIRDGDIGSSHGSEFDIENPYEFKVDFIPSSTTDICECNQSFADACPINSGEFVSALIGPTYFKVSNSSSSTRDRDYYSINVPEAGIIVVDLVTVPASLNLDIFIYNEDQEEIRGNYDVFNSNPYDLEVSVCDPGIYYIYIRDGDIGSSHGIKFDLENPYEFKVDFISSSTTDNCECNQTFAGACPINICSPISALIGPTFNNASNSSSSERDLDTYSIDLSAEIEYSIEITTNADNLDLELLIYNATQELVYSISSNSGNSITTNFTPTMSENHYIVVQDDDGAFNLNEGYELIIGCNTVNTTNTFLSNKIVTFPNPFNDQLLLRFSDSEYKPNSVSLIKINGTKVLDISVNQNEEVSIPTSQLSSGVYILKIQSQEGIYSRLVQKI